MNRINNNGKKYKMESIDKNFRLPKFIERFFMERKMQPNDNEIVIIRLRRFPVFAMLKYLRGRLFELYLI